MPKGKPSIALAATPELCFALQKLLGGIPAIFP
jgi:hypothetical protein